MTRHGESKTDIFISYARTDRAIAYITRELLQNEGWEVWLDEEIAVGEEWRDELDERLFAADAVVVLWTQHSTQSEWVVKEATFALEHDKIYGVKLDACNIKPRFEGKQFAKLKEWNGAEDHREWVRLLQSLRAKVAPSRQYLIRPGFDRDFLGKKFHIGWPKIKGSSRPFHYLHFTVYLDPARRMAVMAAYNVKMRKRGEKGRPIKIREDQTLPEGFQPRRTRIEHYQLGHLACKESMAWGTDIMPRIAGSQAFYLPNIVPQHVLLNFGSYLSVEKWEQWVSDRFGNVSVLCGPIFDPSDKIVAAEEEDENGVVVEYELTVPGAYWKIVAAVDDRGRLSAHAFILENPDWRHTDLAISIEGERYSASMKTLQQSLPAALELPEVLIDAKVLPLRWDSFLNDMPPTDWHPWTSTPRHLNMRDNFVYVNR